MTVVVCFVRCDSEEDLAVLLLLFVLGCATQTKTCQCDCCFVLGFATQKTTELYNCWCLCWDARLRRRLDCASVFFFQRRRLRRMLSYSVVAVLSFGTRDSKEEWNIGLFYFVLFWDARLWKKK